MKSTSLIINQVYHSAKKPGVLLIVCTFFFAFWFNDLLKPYQPHKGETNFVWDATGYYSYLPAIFYYNGTFEFEYEYAKFLPVTDKGLRHPKYTYGVALMESPFFAIGSVFARIQKQATNGFSVPYANAVRWGAVLYLLIGLFFLRKFLLNFFNEVVTTITLFCCLFASMLYMYAFIQGEISHNYIFCLYSVFLFFTLRWHHQPDLQNTLFLALTLGLISIIRFTDIYIVLVFILWNVHSLLGLKQKFGFLVGRFKLLLWFPVVGLVFWIPQCLFWKHHYGTWFFDPYGAEHLFWKDPQIINILFSYRKGWITYTPIAAVAIIGIPFVKSNFPLSRLSFALITGFVIYLFSCWWDWNYGGCFGSRPFCPLIALLAVPLASLTQFLLYSEYPPFLRSVLPALFFLIIFSCTFLNIGQSYQFQEQRKLHPYGMTKYVYREIFHQFHYKTSEEGIVYSKLVFPDHESWINGLKRDDNQK